MANQVPGTGRRALLLGAGVTASAAVAGPAFAAAPLAETFWTSEYWAKKGDVSLYLYRKRLIAPAAGEPPLPVLLLVHGSSMSGRSSFDLTVPGAGEYSMMNVFARYGFDVWTMDFEGYGRSTVTEGNSDIASGVADLRAAVPVIIRTTGAARIHLMGESSGAIRAGAYAMAEPDRVDRLVLEAFTYTGKGSPTLGKRGEQIAYYRAHNRRKRDIDDIRSIFTRDRPGTSDMRVADALGAAELGFGNTVPSGTYLDMVANLPLVDPARVQAPVMIVRGQYDGIASEADLLDFFQKLPNADRQFSVLAGAAHAITLSVNRAELWHSMNAFLTMPKTVQV